MPTRKPSGQHSGGGNYDAKYLKDVMIALVKYPLGFDPGTEWSYHISSNMLGYLIELIAEKTLREYVKETILEPLGMDDTDWYYEPNAQASNSDWDSSSTMRARNPFRRFQTPRSPGAAWS